MQSKHIGLLNVIWTQKNIILIVKICVFHHVYKFLFVIFYLFGLVGMHVISIVGIKMSLISQVLELILEP